MKISNELKWILTNAIEQDRWNNLYSWQTCLEKAMQEYEQLPDDYFDEVSND